MFARVLFCRHGKNRRRCKVRRGTTVVEAAFVLPVFFIVIFGLLEFGHAQMVQNVLRSACREGARLGSTTGNTTADVEAYVRQVMSSAIDPAAVNVFVKDVSSLDSGAALPETQSGLEGLPSVELSDAEPRQMFMVRASVAYSDVAILPNKYFKDVIIEGQAFMRHE